MTPFETRANALLEALYCGMHHCPKIHKHRNGYWWVNHSGDLSTFDFNKLTRLVFLAHDHCIRVEIGASGPRLVKIILSDRKREGSMFARHPTIQQALESHYPQAKVQSVVTCVYCGQAYPSDTPTHGTQVLTDHIRVCEKHPLRAAEAKITRLREAFMRLLQASTPEELDQMETAVKALAAAAPDPNSAADAINAIQVLRETA